MTLRVACIGEAMIELSMQGDTAKVGVAGDTLNTAIYLKRCATETEHRFKNLAHTAEMSRPVSTAGQRPSASRQTEGLPAAKRGRTQPSAQGTNVGGEPPGALQVDYVTCLGDDPFSGQIRDFIAAQGIGTGAIRTIPGKSPGLYAITTTEDGERSFTYWRSAAAARDLFQVGCGFDFSVLEPYDVLYLSGISMAILSQPVRLALIDWLKDAPQTLVYDSNYRPRLWEDQATAQDITRALWARADIALPSVDDEMALFNETEAQVVARVQAYAGIGALKRGAAGPLSLGEPVDQTYPPAATVVDTTAAGDSFNGGYLAALLTGQSQAEALMAGHACAARVVQHRGAIIPE
ncbi:sugar kinase [Roseobacter sinensis]|uniref:Sugar kinase n=1 Tax=Roseobacter sinensis TaxID=2931391 RepID=A0ABT3BAV5_9RHOB|nr:sugar kinase [Roseobacter sp. WL0113]MCV3270278.1 sugar kinase [Roseobacter sp. WL0113]